MTQPTTPGESAALSRELADFLIELSIALHKNAIYPAGHPLLDGAVEGVVRRLTLLLQERSTLALGVARRQLVIEGVVTDPNNSLLRELAQRIHRHHLGAVKFFRGIDREETADFLRTIATDATRTGQPVGLRPIDEIPRWPHARLFPLNFEQLELLDDAPGETPPERRTDETRAAQLWVGLARAAMLAEQAGSAGVSNPHSTDPVVIAKAIDGHRHEVAYDQVIVGYLLQIAEELKRKGGGEALALQRRISKLVSTLDPKTLRRLLNMGGDFAQRQRFVLDATQGMAVDAVLGLVQAAAESSNQTISHSMVRLLSKLAANAEGGAAPKLRRESDRALREHVERLITGWTLDDPNPGAYRHVLDHVARSAPLFAPAETRDDSDPARIVQMALELDSLGPPVERAVHAMLARDEVRPLLDFLDGAPPTSRVVSAVARWVATPEALRDALRSTPPDWTLVDRLIARMKLASVEPLLDALETSTSRQVRRRLLDLLMQLGPDIAPSVAARLPDERWFVTRNMLYLLAELGVSPPGFSAAFYAHHHEPRVRREALRLMLRSPATRELAICAALDDPDERLVRAALSAASGDCPAAAVPVLVRRVSGAELSDDLRPLAIAVLASIRAPEVLDWLMTRVAGGKRLFGGDKLAPKSPEMLAALAGLAVHWRRDQDVASVLALALGSPDPEVRAAIRTGPVRARV